MELPYKNMSLESLEGEIWMPIPNYENLYSISNLGRIKAHKRTHMVGSHGGIRIREEKMITQCKDKQGYLVFSLYKEGKLKVGKSARIVGTIFVSNPENKRTINHINGIKDDNRVINLEWATDSEQQIHRRDVLKMRGSWHNKKRPPFSKEWKKRISEGKKGRKGPRGKLVLNLLNGIYYESANEVSSMLSIKDTTFRAMLRGQFKNKTNFVYV